MRPVLALFLRDLRLSVRQGSDLMLVAGFFVLAALLFPFGIGPEPQLLSRIAGGVIWVTALLAALLSLDRLWARDFEDGTLDLMLTAPTPLFLLVLGKSAAHFLTTGLPLLLLSPLLAGMLHLDPAAQPVLVLSLALGTPCLSLMGGIGAALTLGARAGAALVPLLIIPLVLPVLIFGVGAVEAASTGLGPRPHLLILAACLAGSLTLAPFATAGALRLAAQ